MNLTEAVGGKKYKTRKRVGRGAASGAGKTAGRGMRGDKSRSGSSIPATYIGGQMPLFRRLPKRGFSNKKFQKRPAIVNVGMLANWPGEEAVTPDTLLAAHFIESADNGVKILGNGTVEKPLTVKAHLFSESAKEKILAAGGKVEVIK